MEITLLSYCRVNTYQDNSAYLFFYIFFQNFTKSTVYISYNRIKWQINVTNPHDAKINLGFLLRLVLYQPQVGTVGMQGFQLHLCQVGLCTAQ